jgi:hypothetical protein
MAGKRRAEVGQKSAPTRARASKPVGKVVRGKGLDYRRAMAALVRGATAIAVAQAAGSKATSRRTLGDVGRRIIDTLGTKGQFFETFNRLGYDVERFCGQVTKATEAKKTVRMVVAGELHTFKDDDLYAQASAREQYMTAVGVAKLPQESDLPRTPLSGLTLEELTNLEVGGTASPAPAGAAGPGTGPPAPA